MKDHVKYCETNEPACKCCEREEKSVLETCVPPKTPPCRPEKKACECGLKKPCRCGGTCFKEPRMKRVNCCPFRPCPCSGSRCCSRCGSTFGDGQRCRCGCGR